MIWWILLIYLAGTIKIISLILAIIMGVFAAGAFIVGVAETDFPMYIFTVVFGLFCGLFTVAHLVTPSIQEAAAWIEYVVELDVKHPMYSRIESWLEE